MLSLEKRIDHIRKTSACKLFQWTVTENCDDKDAEDGTVSQGALTKFDQPKNDGSDPYNIEYTEEEFIKEFQNDGDDEEENYANDPR